MYAIEPGRQVFGEGPRIHDDLSAAYDEHDPSDSAVHRLTEAVRALRLRRRREQTSPEQSEHRAFRLNERKLACEGLRATIDQMMQVSADQGIPVAERVRLEDALTWGAAMHVRAYQRHDKVYVPYVTANVQAILHFMDQGLNPFDGLSQANLASPSTIIGRAETELAETDRAEKIEPTPESVDYVRKVIATQIPDTDPTADTIEIPYAE